MFLRQHVLLSLSKQIYTENGLFIQCNPCLTDSFFVCIFDQKLNKQVYAGVAFPARTMLKQKQWYVMIWYPLEESIASDSVLRSKVRHLLVHLFGR